MKTVRLVVPDDLYAVLGEPGLRALAQEALRVRLYALGKIGSGQAAALLGVSRRAFLADILGHYGLSPFDSGIDLAAEALRPILDTMSAGGIRLGPSLRAEVLRAAGEAK